MRISTGYHIFAQAVFGSLILRWAGGLLAPLWFLALRPVQGSNVVGSQPVGARFKQSEHLIPPPTPVTSIILIIILQFSLS